MDLLLKIVSPDKKIFEGEVQQVSLPGTKGPFTILRHHAPIVSSLKKGKITYMTVDGEKELEITSGFIEMNKNRVTVCVTTI
ncbi:MAG: ATP synthase F1 subunit epsilon [Bacteroidales bacterium]|nr:ATP synthase F1 subunit epsilon [Bacteroidales bacterium]